jgi:hypothetical protein
MYTASFFTPKQRRESKAMRFFDFQFGMLHRKLNDEVTLVDIDQTYMFMEQDFGSTANLKPIKLDRSPCIQCN